MIHFDSIRWKNLLSTGNDWNEIDFNKHGTNLIVGENGAGKSTLLDALCFVNFGKPFRKAKKSQLVNTITKKNLVVEVKFHVGSYDYRVVRGMYPNTFEIYQNDYLINQSADVRDYQEVFEKTILRMNYKSFCQVVILGSSLFVPFMQLTTSQRREIIEDILDLQIFTTMNEILKGRVSQNQETVRSIQTEHRLVEEKMLLIKQHLAEITGNNERDIEEKKERIADTSNQLVELQAKYEESMAVVGGIQARLINDKKVSKRIDDLLHLKHQIEAKIAIMNHDVEFFSTNDECPTCKQLIDDEFKNTTIVTKKSEIEETEAGLKLLVQKYDETNAVLQDNMNLVSQINDVQMEAFKIKNSMDSLMEYRKKLEEELGSIAKRQEELDDSKLHEYAAVITQLTRDYKTTVDKRKILAAAGILLRDGGIKARIIKQYVPIINKLVNKYLSAMDFFVQFELDEEFNEKIKSRYRDEFTYSLFSEGEKMRIDLALLFTWRAIAKMRSSSATNILIMDEVIDSSLDQNGTDEFLKIIKELTSDTNTFIISHKGDVIFDKFDNVISFKKHQNFSRIVEL